MENRERKLFTIYSQRLAGYLMQRGFVLISMAHNSNSKNVFLFRDTPALHDALDRWMIYRYQEEQHGA